MKKITIKELMAGTLDIDEIDMVDIQEFCESSNGLEEYKVDADKTKPEILNEIAERIDETCSISVKAYAEAHGITNADVQSITGKGHWNHRLGYMDLEKLEAAALDPKETVTASVNPEEESVPTEKEIKPMGYLARRKARQEEKMKGVYLKKGYTENIPPYLQRRLDRKNGGNQ